MRKVIKVHGIGIVAALALTFGAVAASGAEAVTAQERAAIEQQIRDTLEAEQRALVSGGCEAALAFFADREPLFISGGRTKANRAAVRSSCATMTPAPGSPRRKLQQHAVHVLSPVTGYSVSTYRTAQGDDQVITKVWEKQGAAWRIVHFHESDSR